MYKLSLIIPIYKVEKYIEECLLSILEQITPEIQIICVNDGTLDESMSIAELLISEYNAAIQKQFLFINQKNQGLSVARNTGMKIAEGDYIGFVDSDDKIMPNYFNVLLEKINLNTYDIIDFNIVTSSGDRIHTREGDINSLDSVFQSSAWYCPARIFKRDLIAEYRFFPNLYYEDLALTPSLYIDAKSTAHISQSLYWYRMNEEGITLSSSDHNNNRTVNSLSVIVDHYLNLYKENKIPYLAVITMQCHFLLCTNSCKRLGLSSSLSYIKQYKNDFKEINAKYSLEVRYFSLLSSRVRVFHSHPKIYLLLYSIFCKVR